MYQLFWLAFMATSPVLLMGIFFVVIGIRDLRTERAIRRYLLLHPECVWLQQCLDRADEMVNRLDFGLGAIATWLWMLVSLFVM